MRLCLERILPPCRERMVKFVLPSIESAADIAAAMKAVTSALAAGLITPGKAARIAAVVDTFVRAIETSDFERRLQLVETDHFNQPGEAATCTAPVRMGTTTTHRRKFAADSLQMARHETIYSIHDCGMPDACAFGGQAMPPVIRFADPNHTPPDRERRYA
jgi:hypothetical protein